MLSGNWIRRLFALAVLTAVAAGAAACDNTIRGMGRDAQQSSDAITDATN